MRLAILGNCLLSRHLVRLINEEHDYVHVFLWTLSPTSAPEFDSVLPMHRFTGFPELHRAIAAVDIVVNLHEFQDFSMWPNKEMLNKHNVEFVRNVIYNIRCPLIHISSPLVQCSVRWPNVHEPEKTAECYRSQWPFPEYCKSKHEAEQLVETSDIDAFILRCVPCYGEGDDCSLLTDIIKYDKNSVLNIGDGDGVSQMAYAGNVASAIWLACCKILATSTSLDLNVTYSEAELSDLTNDSSMRFDSHYSQMDSIREEVNVFGRQRLSTVIEEPSEEVGLQAEEVTTATEIVHEESAFNITTNATEKVFETFLINDNTAKGHVCDVFKQLLETENRKIRVPVSTHLVYWCFYLLTIFVNLLSYFLPDLQWPQSLPCPAFFTMHFHQWTFFNSHKCEILLDASPIYDQQESFERCQAYYNSLTPEDIPRYSFEAHV